MAKVLEQSKIERIGRLWCVLILSAATGRWIVQGEHLTKRAAEIDLAMWRA